MEGESCRRAKEEGVLGRRLPPSEVTRETDRVSSRRALGVAFGRPLPPPSGQASWSSRGVTKGRVRSWKEDKGVPGRSGHRTDRQFRLQAWLGLAERLSRSV